MMVQENLGRALVAEKYPKKKITKCREGHCYQTVISTRE